MMELVSTLALFKLISAFILLSIITSIVVSIIQNKKTLFRIEKEANTDIMGFYIDSYVKDYAKTMRKLTTSNNILGYILIGMFGLILMGLIIF